jgi:hypothetical protein
MLCESFITHSLLLGVSLSCIPQHGANIKDSFGKTLTISQSTIHLATFIFIYNYLIIVYYKIQSEYIEVAKVDEIPSGKMKSVEVNGKAILGYCVCY